MVELPAVADLETRRKRARYRANYRGTKEMDFLLGRFAGKHVAGMDEADLETFEAFLAVSDPDIQAWLTDTPPAVPAAPPDPKFRALVDRIRQFHGLSALPG